MKTPLINRPHYFFSCPQCGYEFEATHLVANEPKSFGTWYCDQCGEGTKGTIYPDGTADIEASGDRLDRTLVLLKLPTSWKPVFLIVSGIRFSGQDASGDRYHYEEKTCPENYLRQTCVVIEGKDTDPHGLLDYVATIPATSDLLSIKGQASDRLSNATFAELDQLFGGQISEHS